MFVEDFVGEWNSNPLSRRRFTIRNPEEIDALKSSKVIDAVIINTAKGLDVEGVGGADANAARLRMVQAAAHDPEARKKAIDSVNNSVAALKDLMGDVADTPISVENMAPVADELVRTMQTNPLVLLSMTRLKSKDATTFIHSVGVSALMIQLSQYLGMDDATVQLMGVAGLLHDIGKTKIPDEVLNKNGKLTDEEFAMIRSHPVIGHELLLKHADVPRVVLDICRHHHERLDGTGYPDKLDARSIGLQVRISTICDVYDAVTSIRPYKKPWTHADAVAWMLAQRGAFDRELLHEFFSSMEQVLAPAKRAAAAT